MEKIKRLAANNWLFALIAIQPLLDAAAYFTQGSGSTLSGYFRLLVMLALPLYLLITLKKKKRFIISMGVIALFCALHFFSCMRAGYVSVSYDVAYMARVAQLPILAISFIYLIRDERTKAQAIRGILAAAVIYVLLLALSVATGTANSTYGDGIGLSGWTPDDNRTANSLVLVSLCCFCMYVAAKTEKKYAQALIPAMVFVLLLSNGTKSCYVSAMAFFAGFAVFLTLEKLLCGKSAKKLLILVLLVLFAASFAVYPYTPRAKVDALQADNSNMLQQRFDADLAEAGYTPGMTMEQMLGTPAVRAVFEEYYNLMLRCKIPDLIDNYDMERIIAKYGMTTSIAELDKTRTEKIVYASLMQEDSDILTRLFGLEVSKIALGTKYDLENDWPAIFFYYGYVGAALYGAFILWFFYLVIRKLSRDFKGSLTTLNFTLLTALVLQIGLAQYSGALLRRPNVSIYMSLVLALIYFQTAVSGADSEGSGLNEA